MIPSLLVAAAVAAPAAPVPRDTIANLTSPAPRVVAPSNAYGDIYVTSKPFTQHTYRGGALLSSHDLPTGRVHVTALDGAKPTLTVGDRFAGPLTGVVDWSSFGGFTVDASSLPPVVPGGLTRTVAGAALPGELHERAPPRADVQHAVPRLQARRRDGVLELARDRVLERLRRAGLHIREVAPAAEAARGVEVARIAVGGRVGDIVRAVLGDAPVTEGDDMTTAEVVLSSADVLFDVIERLGGLGLELRSVHVGRSASPGPDPAGS